MRYSSDDFYLLPVDSSSNRYLSNHMFNYPQWVMLILPIVKCFAAQLREGVPELKERNAGHTHYNRVRK